MNDDKEWCETQKILTDTQHVQTEKKNYWIM